MPEKDHDDTERTEVIGAEAPTPTSTTTSAEPGTEHTTWMGDWQEQDAGSPSEERRSGLAEGVHPLQTGYLVLGLLAIGTALMWLLTEADVIAIGDGGAAFSVVLITAGAIGLMASLGRALRR